MLCIFERSFWQGFLVLKSSVECTYEARLHPITTPHLIFSTTALRQAMCIGIEKRERVRDWIEMEIKCIGKLKAFCLSVCLSVNGGLATQ